MRFCSVLRPVSISLSLRRLFEPGEMVRVIDGPFNDFNGVVEDVNYEKSRLKCGGIDFWSVDTG